MVAAVVVLALLVLLCVVSPFMLWRSYFHVVRSVVFSAQLPLRGRLSMLAHLAKDLASTPLLTCLWFIDDLVWPAYRRGPLTPPVFVMSQPRSGTTFLLRTLASDTESFFVLKHLDWRVPSIGFWKLISWLDLRQRLERIDYWPDTQAGRLASKMHSHNLGSVEGHGVFFEERMYHHYFTYRRFPLPEVLRRLGGVAALSAGERKKIVGTLRRAVQRAAFHHGDGRIWLTKENENVDLFRLVLEAFPGARFIVTLRKPTAFVSSYIRMSDSCTTPKHGVDPNTIEGWYAANLDFRRDECDKHMAFCQELEADGAVTYLSFEALTSDTHGALSEAYRRLGIDMPGSFSQRLRLLQREQDTRSTGYVNPPRDVEGFERYADFVRAKTLPPRELQRA